MNERRDWSEREVTETVEDYLDMLERELKGIAYNKAEHNRRLTGRLDGRSKQSVEFKHANISAWMVENGLPYIDGYKPRGNYQALIGTVASQLVAARPGFSTVIGSALNQVPSLDIGLLPRLADAPALFQRNTRAPRRVQGSSLPDFVALHEQHRKLGDLGERLVIDIERNDLALSGRPDLAGKICWTAQEDGPTAGYDVRSFFPDGREKFIEVKTTNFGHYYPFFLSAHELEVSRDLGDRYRLYRLFELRRQPQYYQLEPPLEQRCRLRPIQYAAVFDTDN